MSQLPATKYGCPFTFRSKPPLVSVPEVRTICPEPLTRMRYGAESPPRLKNQLVGVGYQNDRGKNCVPIGEIIERLEFSLTFNLYSTTADIVASGLTAGNRIAIRCKLPAAPTFSSLFAKSAFASLIFTDEISASGLIRSVRDPAGRPETFFSDKIAENPTVLAA